MADGDDEMVADIDDKLRALGQLPDHPALDGIEDRVLASIDARRAEAGGQRMTAGLAVGALLIGAAGATLPSKQAVASTPVTFAEPGPLAPSSLLLGSGER
ncbi:hypothetical protein [Sphingomonas koreensis]